MRLTAELLTLQRDNFKSHYSRCGGTYLESQVLGRQEEHMSPPFQGHLEQQRKTILLGIQQGPLLSLGRCQTQTCGL